MKKIFAVLLGFFFIFAGAIYGQQGKVTFNSTFTLESINTTGVSAREFLGADTANSNIHKLRYTPKIRFGKSPWEFGLMVQGTMDNLSTSFSGGFVVGTDHFALTLGGGITNYKSDQMRDSVNGKPRENFGLGRLWVGANKFEGVVYAEGNTNSLKYLFGKMMYFPEKYIGVGVVIEKNYPRNLAVLGYGEGNFQFNGLVFKLFGGVGGYGENSKVILKAMFGGKIDIPLPFRTEKKKKKCYSKL